MLARVVPIRERRLSNSKITCENLSSLFFRSWCFTNQLGLDRVAMLRHKNPRRYLTSAMRLLGRICEVSIRRWTCFELSHYAAASR